MGSDIRREKGARNHGISIICQIEGSSVLRSALGRHVESYAVPGYAQEGQDHGAAKNTGDSSISKSQELERIQHIRQRQG